MKTRINNVKKGVVTLLFAAVIAGLTACETDPVKSQRGELPDKDLMQHKTRKKPVFPHLQKDRFRQRLRYLHRFYGQCARLSHSINSTGQIPPAALPCQFC